MTPTKKLIVRFKDGEAPVNAMPLAILENQPRIERLYKIDDEVQSFKSKNMESASLHATDEEIFQTEVYPQKTEEEKKLFNTFSVECDSTEQAAEVHDSLKKDDNVEFVQFDELNVLYLHPNDPLISNVWSLTKISCEPAWDISQGDDIVVAVIDTGVDYNHPDISANMWDDGNGKHGFDFSENTDDPLDSFGHGTHCAGTIAAVLNNSVGIAGDSEKQNKAGVS